MNLPDLIKTGESRTVEFKEKFDERTIESAVAHVKENRQITNKEYQEINKISKRTASRDLLDLVSSGIFEQIGTIGTGIAYILKGPMGPQKGHNGVKYNQAPF